jgi:hypothetical protein
MEPVRSGQGRSQNQIACNEKVAGYTAVGFIALLILAIIL